MTVSKYVPFKTFGFKRRQVWAGVFVAAFAIVGTGLLLASHAATPTASLQTEAGRQNNTTVLNDTTASGGQAVEFSSPAPNGGRVVNVATAAQLTAALSGAQPGDVIMLADGDYSGHFNSTVSGTATSPITLTGGRNAIIDGGALTSGYTFSLGTKDTTTSMGYWKLQGFTVTGGQKGMVLDDVQHSLINSVYVHQIGEEGIHLRDNSASNTVQNSTVTKTGQDQQAYGEGIYVGSAVSNWSAFSNDSADHSNNNQFLNNNISYTGAENMDIKEGTHAGLIQGGTFDGSGMCWDTTADCNYADSFIDMKGEGWTVTRNNFAHMHVTWVKGGQTNDGIQDHVISNTGSEGSGTDNTFASNTIDDVGGYGFNIEKTATGIVVKCSNTVTNSGSGFGNVTCTP